MQTTGFLVKNDITTIGRTDDNNLPLKDIKISRAHCQIVKTPSGYKIVDLNSGNGTRVNNEKIKERVLQDKDLIKVGDVQIVFDATESSSASQSPVKVPVKTSASVAQSDMDHQQTVIVKPAVVVKAVSTVSKPSVANGGVKTAGTPISVKPSTIPAKKGAGASFSKLSGLKKPGKPLSSRKTKTGKANGDDNSEENGSSVAKPKKSNTLLIGIISAVVLVVIIGTVLMMGGSKDKGKEESPAKSETKELYEKIQTASQKGNYQEGLELCDKFLERYKTSKLASKVKETQEDLQKRMARETEAQLQWKPLKAEADAAGTDEASGVLAKLKTFAEKYNGTQAATFAVDEAEKLQNLIQMTNSPARQFNELRARIYRELVSQNKYDEAIKEFEDFMKQNSGDSIICEQIKQEVNQLKEKK